MKSLIVFLDKIYTIYKADNKLLKKVFLIAAIINIVLLYLQQVYKEQFSVDTHIYNNISNFLFFLLFYILIDSFNNHKNKLSESIKKIVCKKTIFLIIGYIIFIVPAYVIYVILPNERFFAAPLIRLVSFVVYLILITIFELFTVALTLYSDKNFFIILKNVFVSLKKALLKLTLLKIAFFVLILAPGVMLFILGSVISQVIALILLMLLPLTVMPIYAFCSNILITGIFDIQNGIVD
ncbi:MAG: hypothetical protein LBM59_03890 [Ruminococcus sp.]|nr:hypothetical protein [Ruminococcus sp.]